MPKLRAHTIGEHRSDVRAEILNAAASIIEEQGTLALTMAGVARAAGIGRSTLYRYFSDVEAIVRATHEVRVAAHLAELSRVAGRHASYSTLKTFLTTYARNTASHSGRSSTLAVMLHATPAASLAHQELQATLRQLIAEAAARDVVRNDIDPGELAHYCVAALSVPRASTGKPATDHMVQLVLDGLRARNI